MRGVVDESFRALVDVKIAADKIAPREILTAWIDTAFNGSRVIPRPELERMGMKQGSTTQAVLADGQVADVETYTCFVEWFGKVYQTQVIANDGKYPLLGTKLLAARKLMIDYSTGIVELT